MLTLMVILVAAALGHGLASWRRLPLIPVLVGMGLLLDAAGIAGPVGTREDALRLGLTFVLFMVAAELDPAFVGGRRRSAFLLGLAHLGLMGGVTLAVVLGLGFELRAAAYAGLAVAGSSTLVVVSVLRRREQVFEDVGRTAIGVVLLQDLVVILGLPLVGAADLAGAATGLGGTLALLALAVALARWVAPVVVPQLAGEGEAMLLLILAVLFVFAGLADALGVAPEVGAFLAGLTFARFPVAGLVRGPMGSLSDFFVAVFCVALGTTVRVEGLGELLLPVLLLVGLLVVAPLLLVPVARLGGLATRPAVEVSGLLAQCGELAVAVMLVGLAAGHVPEELFRSVVIVAVITMLLSPLLSSDVAVWRLLHLQGRLGGQGSLPVADGRTVFIGCGTATRALIGRVSAAGHPVLAVDDDPAVVSELEAAGVDAIRGDGGDPRLLHRIGLRRARAVVSTMRRRRDHERLLELSGDVPVVVRTFDPGTAATLRAAGARVVSEAESAEAAFIEWLDGDRAGLGGDRCPSA